MRAFFNLALIITGTLSVVLTLSSCSNNVSKWTKYSDRNFSITMPEKPQVYDRQEATPFGKQTVHYVSWKPESL